MAKPRDQLALEAKIPTCNASNIIKDWKNAMNISDIEELEEFSVQVRKSGIIIDKCTRIYRMMQLMKSLGINADGNLNITNNNNKRSNNIDRIRNYNEFFTFVKAYINCKNFGQVWYYIFID